MVFSLPFFIALACWSVHRNPSKLKTIRKSLLPLIVLGLCGFYIASFLDLEGLRFIDASLERVILFIYPTLVVLLSYLWYGETINRRQLAAIVITYIGILCAFGGNISAQQDSAIILGTCFVLGSALSYGIYLVGSQSMLTRLDALTYNSLSMTVATLAILFHQVVITRSNMFGFETPVYIYGVLIALISTVLPSFMIMEGIHRIGAASSSIIGTVGPVSTIALAYLLLEERMNLAQAIGSMVVIAGVLLLVLTGHRKIPSTETS